jgi:predicted metal-dependent peptidase
MACDADVHEIYELTEGDRVPAKFSGGGGTRTEPVFEKVNELGLQPYALVYLTDGYASYPPIEPEYPVLWVLTPQHERPPWGRATVLDLEGPS